MALLARRMLLRSRIRGVDSRYYAYLFRIGTYMEEVNKYSHGIVTDRNRLYWDEFKQIPSVYPSPDEQEAITRYLDHQSLVISRLTHRKRSLIALLNEQKQAIIRHAVTRGLDPRVRLKPSGVPSLGDIPEHWEVRRIKQVSRILRGKFSHRPRNDASLYGGDYPFIQTGAVARAKKLITNYSQTLNERGLSISKLFPKGTLVMTIAANIGDVAVLSFDACFPDSVVGFVPSAAADRDFLFLVLRSMKTELLREAPVNTQGNLNVERIGVMNIPCPPIEEQRRIASAVEDEYIILDQAVDRTERDINLIREYRSRLIAEIVTGQLDVRNAAAGLPAAVEEADATTEVDDEAEEPLEAVADDD